MESARGNDDGVELFDAIRRDDVDAVARMLAEDPERAAARTPAGETPLHVAVEQNDPRLIEALLDRGADPSLVYGKSAHTALSWAITVNSFDAAAALVRRGVKPDLFCAAGLGDLEAVRSFFDAREMSAAAHRKPAAADLPVTARVCPARLNRPGKWSPMRCTSPPDRHARG